MVRTLSCPNAAQFNRMVCMNIPIGISCMSMGIKGVIDVLSEAK